MFYHTIPPTKSHAGALSFTICFQLPDRRAFPRFCSPSPLASRPQSRYDREEQSHRGPAVPLQGDTAMFFNFFNQYEAPKQDASPVRKKGAARFF